MARKNKSKVFSQRFPQLQEGEEDLGALIDQAAFKFYAQQLADGVPYEETVYGKTDAALEKIRSGAISTKEAMAVLDSNAKLADCYWQHLEAQDPRASDTLCQRCWKWLSWEEVQAKG